MIFSPLMSLFSLFFDLLAILGLAKNDKDLELINLAQQLRILLRKMKTTPRISHPERVILAALTNRYRQSTVDARQRLHHFMLIFEPTKYLVGIETWFAVSGPSDEKQNQVSPGYRLK
jgi:hypothetical protein